MSPGNICNMTGAPQREFPPHCCLPRFSPNPTSPDSAAADVGARVSPRSLLSLWGHQRSRQVTSCDIITGPVPFTMTTWTYCMCHTIIILKIHSRGKAKTMSVSADARRWRKATQWRFCCHVCRPVELCSGESLILLLLVTQVHLHPSSLWVWVLTGQFIKNELIWEVL